MRDNILLIIILTSLFFLAFTFLLLGSGVFKTEDLKQAQENTEYVKKNSDEEPLLLNKYFEEREAEADDTKDVEGETECIMFGQKMQEGAVNSNTICTKEPKD